MLGDGDSPPLANCVCVAVEILEVVEEVAAAECSAALPSLMAPLLPLQDTEEVVVAEAVLLLLNDAVVAFEAELLVQLLAPPTPYGEEEDEEVEVRRPNLSPCSRSSRSRVSSACRISCLVMPVRRSRCSRSICSIVNRGSSLNSDILLLDRRKNKTRQVERQKEKIKVGGRNARGS